MGTDRLIDGRKLKLEILTVYTLWEKQETTKSQKATKPLIQMISSGSPQRRAEHTVPSLDLAPIALLNTKSFPGGMKTVLWTDLFQSFLMFGSMFAVLIAGTYRVGGLSNVMLEVVEGGRLEFGK